ncbi:MAG TPA: hypothetical protein VGJ03_10670 [Acidimicrobiales bacterium]
MTAPLLTDGMRHRIAAVPDAFHIRRLELLRDLPGNRCGVEIRRFSDTVFATVAAALPEVGWMQHVGGLAPGDEALVPKIAAWYHGLGLRPRFEIAPAPDSEPLAAALTDARARQTGFLDTLWARTAPPTGEAPNGVDVRVVTPRSEEAALFARVHLGGHEVSDDGFTEHWAAIGLWPSEPEWWCYLASVAGESVGSAALAVDDGIGYFANASTLPSGRRRGCQQALIHRRLHDAAAAGCELTVSLATPGTSSHRNLERAGLVVACTNVFWTVVD